MLRFAQVRAEFAEEIVVRARQIFGLMLGFAAAVLPRTPCSVLSCTKCLDSAESRFRKHGLPKCQEAT